MKILLLILYNHNEFSKKYEIVDACFKFQIEISVSHTKGHDILR